jgi:AraC-like DNA-binding protein
MKIKKTVFLESIEKLENDYEIIYFSGIGNAGNFIQSHSFHEMYMLLAGEVAYQTKDGIYILNPGDIMFFGAYVKHCPIVLNRSLPYERIVLKINPVKLQYLSRNVLNLAECFNLEKNGFFRFPYPVQNYIRFILGKLLGLRQSTPFGHELLADSYLIELFVAISEYIQMESSMMMTSDIKAHQLLAIIDQYINENIEHNILVEDIAKFVCMNKYSLMRTFKNITGKTMYQYIITKRLEAAEKMIRSGIDFISAAYSCGFSDYSCFYRSFVNYYGMSPKEYFNSNINMFSARQIKDGN